MKHGFLKIAFLFSSVSDVLVEPRTHDLFHLFSYDVMSRSIVVEVSRPFEPLPPRQQQQQQHQH
jgi:hypothetical protein